MLALFSSLSIILVDMLIRWIYKIAGYLPITILNLSHRFVSEKLVIFSTAIIVKLNGQYAVILQQGAFQQQFLLEQHWQSPLL